jgi:hypothetical protein
MKIKGWEKISGFTYKGYTIVNPIHNADETMYEATILNLNLPQKPKWELNVLTPKHKWKMDDAFSVIVRDDENRSTINTVDKQRMASIAIFRNTFEKMVDKMLAMRLTSAVSPISHSIVNNSSYGKTINPNLYGNVVVTGTGGGLMNTINSNGNTIPYGQMVQTTQSLLAEIKKLNTIC